MWLCNFLAIKVDVSFSILFQCCSALMSKNGKKLSDIKIYQGLNLLFSSTHHLIERMFCHQTWNLYNFMGQSHNNFLLHDLRSFHHRSIYEMQFSRRFCKFVYAINSLSPIPKRKLSKYKIEFAISFHLLRLMLQHDWCFHDVTFHNWTNFDASKL